MKDITMLMSSSYAERFPASYIEEFYKQAQYQMGAISLHNLELAVDECFGHLRKAIPVETTLDSLVLSGIRVFFNMQKIMIKLFLFFRLRKVSWLLVRRVFFRLRRKITGSV